MKSEILLDYAAPCAQAARTSLRTALTDTARHLTEGIRAVFLPVRKVFRLCGVFTLTVAAQTRRCAHYATWALRLHAP
jgi:hypothetical protein